MNAVDAKDRQAFAELQQRVIEHTTKLKHLQQQATALISTGRRASLTAKELSALPDGTHTYQSVGRAYFLQPRSKILEELTDRERTCTTELERLKGSRAALEKGAGAAEGELRELLQSSPALARALSKQ